MIQIEWLSDEHECETCGCTYAEGARVTSIEYPEPRVVFAFIPHAWCQGGDSWDREHVYLGILEALGHEIVEV